MKSNRNRAFLKDAPASEAKSHFGFLSILHNIIFSAAIIVVYWFLLTRNLVPDYINYIYWTVNVLVVYNVIAASARSFLAPILTLLVAVGIWFTPVQYISLTPAEFYEIAIVGVVGLIIAIIIKL